jgi:hypothetical protein
LHFAVLAFEKMISALWRQLRDTGGFDAPPWLANLTPVRTRAGVLLVNGHGCRPRTRQSNGMPALPNPKSRNRPFATHGVCDAVLIPFAS